MTAHFSAALGTSKRAAPSRVAYPLPSLQTVGPSSLSFSQRHLNSRRVADLSGTFLVGPTFGRVAWAKSSFAIDRNRGAVFLALSTHSNAEGAPFSKCEGGSWVALSFRSNTFHNSFEYLLDYLIDFINIPYYAVLCSPRRMSPVVVPAVLPYCRLKTVG